MHLRSRPGAAIVTILAAVACGGKETGQVNDTPDPGGASTTVTPTCGVICSHIVGTCFPGASLDACATDCERSRQQFAFCPRYLDPYLVCMSHSSLECHTSDVVILDCSPERDRLEACVP